MILLFAWSAARSAPGVVDRIVAAVGRTIGITVTAGLFFAVNTSGYRDQFKCANRAESDCLSKVGDLG